MAHLVQKGSNEYKQLLGKSVRAFGLVLLAGASLTGCNTLHNIGESTSQAIEGTYYDITGQDMVCGKQAQNLSNRNSTGGWFESGSHGVKGNAGVTQNCVSQKTELEKALLEKQRVTQLGQADIQAQIMKKQAETQAEIQKKQMDINFDLSIKQECQNKYKQSILSGTEMSSEHACFTKGYLSAEANGVVMPAKKAPSAKQQKQAPTEQTQKGFTNNPLDGKFWSSRFNQ